MKKLLVLPLVLMLLFAAAHALHPELIQANREYSAVGNVSFRDAPPRTIFYILGEKIGHVGRGEKVTVKSIKEVNTLFNTHYWLNVDRENPSTNQMESGWVYAGAAGDDSYWEVVK